MDPDLLRTKGVNPVNIRHASVLGFSLRIGQRATLVPDSKGRVFGMLMQLTHDEVDRLYSDPSVKAYRVEPVMAKLGDGSGIPALCFNLPLEASSMEVSSEYAAKLRYLASRLGFPQDYVDSIH